MKPRILVVWHSQTGASRQLAEAIARGCGSESQVDVRLLHAASVAAADIQAAAGWIVVAPEYLGGMAGAVKDMFDRCYYTLLDRIEGKPFAIAVCAGSDGLIAIRDIQRIASGLRQRLIAEPLLIKTFAQTPQAILAPKLLSAGDLARGEELGATLAAGLGMGVF